jgi:hypothetical protein
MQQQQQQQQHQQGDELYAAKLMDISASKGLGSSASGCHVIQQ